MKYALFLKICKSYELIRLISQNKIEWTFEELVHLKRDLYTEALNNLGNISNYSEKDIKLFESPKLLEVSNDIYYADVECDPSKLHEAYCICYMRYDEDEPHFFYGRNCLYKFLDNIPNESVVYFHNLGCDITAFHHFLRTKSIKVLSGELIK